jgi:hypothetical protein
MSGLAPPVTLSRNGWAVMRWALSCLAPPVNLSRSGWAGMRRAAIDISSAGVRRSLVSLHRLLSRGMGGIGPPVRLSRSGWAMRRRALKQGRDRGKDTLRPQSSSWAEIAANICPGVPLTKQRGLGHCVYDYEALTAGTSENRRLMPAKMSAIGDQVRGGVMGGWKKKCIKRRIDEPYPIS